MVLRQRHLVTTLVLIASVSPSTGVGDNPNQSSKDTTLSLSNASVTYASSSVIVMRCTVEKAPGIKETLGVQYRTGVTESWRDSTGTTTALKNASGPQKITALLTGLQPSTWYSLRVVLYHSKDSGHRPDANDTSLYLNATTKDPGDSLNEAMSEHHRLYVGGAVMLALTAVSASSAAAIMTIWCLRYKDTASTLSTPRPTTDDTEPQRVNSSFRTSTENTCYTRQSLLQAQQNRIDSGRRRQNGRPVQMGSQRSESQQREFQEQDDVIEEEQTCYLSPRPSANSRNPTRGHALRGRAPATLPNEISEDGNEGYEECGAVVSSRRHKYNTGLGHGATRGRTSYEI